MKKLLLCILISVVFASNSWTQDLLGFESIAGNDRIDYKKAEIKALEASVYLLNTAIDSSKTERENAVTNMLIWMEGTPDFIFYIDENVYFFTRSKKTLLAIYLAGLTKLSLENPTLAKNRNELKYRTMQLFIEYCTNPSNNVISYRELEQLVKANEKGRLRNYAED